MIAIPISYARRTSRTSLRRSGQIGPVAAAVVLLGLAAPAAAANPQEAFSGHAAGSVRTVDHSAWDDLLGRFVVAGKDGVNRVDYARFKAEGHAPLKAYVARLEAVDGVSLHRPEQFAFWGNLYNAKTIDIVLDKYPVASIRDIKSDGLRWSPRPGHRWPVEGQGRRGRRTPAQPRRH